MRSKCQKGSAGVIVLIVIVVALLAMLGYEFWKNSHNDDTQKPNTTSKVQNKTSDKAKTTEHCLTTEKLCLDLPQNWMMKQSTMPVMKDMPASDTATLYAGSVRVLSVNDGITGVGGVCSPDTKSTLTVTKTEKTTATSGDSPAKPVYAVEALYHDPAKGYVPMIFLSSTVMNSGTTTECHPDLSALYASKHVKNSLVGVGNYLAGSEFEYLKSKSDATIILTSKNYTEGFMVLASAHYE